MPIKLSRKGKLTPWEWRELRDAETRGYLIMPEHAHQELLTRYWDNCSRNCGIFWRSSRKQQEGKSF
jgi:hypothetical protein